MRITDRSRTETYFTCPRKRYLQYELGGRGYSPSPSPDQLFGLAIHSALDAVLSQRAPDLSSIDGIFGITPDGYPLADEYKALAWGFVDAALHYYLPYLLEEYDIIQHPELNVSLPLADGLDYITRLDLSVRRKADKMPFVLEWKTTSYPNTLRWQLEFQLQLLMEAACLEAHLGEPVGGVILVGINKGWKQAVSKKEASMGMNGHRRLSPFTYCWKEPNSGWHSKLPYEAEYDISRKNDWARVPTWIDPGPEQWLDYLNQHFPEVWQETFIDCGVVYAAPGRVETVSQQILKIEQLILTEPENWAHQNFQNCRQDSGIRNKECPFVPVCHEGIRVEALFEPRVPHHASEINLLSMRLE